MAYDVYLLSVAHGADVEETGEALLARLAGADEISAPPHDPSASALIAALRRAEPTLGAVPERERHGEPAPQHAVHVVEVRDRAGIEVTAGRGFARFRVPFRHRGDEATETFERLFRLLRVAESSTGWSPYDPQEGEAFSLDDDARDEVLEIYLSVMDQLRPTGSPRGTP